MGKEPRRDRCVWCSRKKAIKGALQELRPLTIDMGHHAAARRARVLVAQPPEYPLASSGKGQKEAVSTYGTRFWVGAI